MNNDKTIIELFSHQCPEPVYDMLRKYIEKYPNKKFDVLRKE
jgi:hypothetical protein